MTIRALCVLIALPRVVTLYSARYARAARSSAPLSTRATAALGDAAASENKTMSADGGGFGDVMGGYRTTVPFLPQFTPLERMAITATGNLQRLISSFYNLPVTVNCVRNEPLADRVYTREVRTHASPALEPATPSPRAPPRASHSARAAGSPAGPIARSGWAGACARAAKRR